MLSSPLVTLSKNNFKKEADSLHDAARIAINASKDIKNRKERMEALETSRKEVEELFNDPSYWIMENVHENHAIPQTLRKIRAFYEEQEQITIKSLYSHVLSLTEDHEKITDQNKRKNTAQSLSKAQSMKPRTIQGLQDIIASLEPEKKFTTEEKSAIQQDIEKTENQSKKLLSHLHTHLQPETYNKLHDILQKEKNYANQNLEVTVLNTLFKNLENLSEKIRFFYEEKERLSKILKDDLESLKKLNPCSDTTLEEDYLKKFSEKTFDQLVDVDIVSGNFNLDKAHNFFHAFENSCILLRTSVNEKNLPFLTSQIRQLLKQKKIKIESSCNVLSEEKNSCFEIINQSFLELCRQEKQLLTHIQQLKLPQEEGQDPSIETQNLITAAENLLTRIKNFIEPEIITTLTMLHGKEFSLKKERDLLVLKAYIEPDNKAQPCLFLLQKYRDYLNMRLIKKNAPAELPECPREEEQKQQMSHRWKSVALFKLKTLKIAPPIEPIDALEKEISETIERLHREADSPARKVEKQILANHISLYKKTRDLKPLETYRDDINTRLAAVTPPPQRREKH